MVMVPFLSSRILGHWLLLIVICLLVPASVPHVEVGRSGVCPSEPSHCLSQLTARVAWLPQDSNTSGELFVPT